jgi:hypothetical protein
VTDGLSPIPDDGRVFGKLESADPAGWPRRPGGPLGDAGPGPRAGGRVHVTGTGALRGLRLRVPVAASLQWAVFATRSRLPAGLRPFRWIQAWDRDVAAAAQPEARPGPACSGRAVGSGLPAA